MTTTRATLAIPSMPVPLPVAHATALRDHTPVFVPTSEFTDHRGRSLMNQMLGVLSPAGQINYSVQYPGVIKAWHRHRRQTDFWLCVQGHLRVGVFDEASDRAWALVIGERNQGVVIIPPSLWHGANTVGDQSAGLLYYVTHAYDPANPDEDRRPFDSVAGFPWGPRHGYPLSSALPVPLGAAPRSMRPQPSRRRVGGIVSSFLREAALQASRWRMPHAERRVLFLPCGSRRLGSSNLRAFALAEALRPLGWRAIVVPHRLSLGQRRRVLRSERPDILVIQKGRHPLNWADEYAGAFARVFDLDDADYVRTEWAEQCAFNCRHAHLVTAGSENVAQFCLEFNQRVEVVWTGHPLPATRAATPPSRRAPIVAWAQSGSMDYPEEAGIVTEALLKLATSHRFTFRLYGVAPGRCADAAVFLDPLRRAGVACEVVRHLDSKRFLASLSQVAVGLHVLSARNPFASGKSFGKVLSYASADVPVVASDLYEDPRFFRHGENGLLAGDANDLARHTAALLDTPSLRDQLAQVNYQRFSVEQSIGAIAVQVDRLYRDLLASRAQAGSMTSSGGG